MIRMQLCALDAIHDAASNRLGSTLLNALHSTLLSTLSSTLPSTLSSTFPIALAGTLLACLPVRSQVRSQAQAPVCFWLHSIARSQLACLHTSKYALKYAPYCTQLYTSSLLGCSLPCTLPRRALMWRLSTALGCRDSLSKRCLAASGM